MAAVMLAATIVPVCATTETDEQRMKINKQTSECAETLAPLVTGTILGTAGAIGGAVSAIAGNGIMPLGVSGACSIIALACMAKWHTLYNSYKNNFSEKDVKAIDWKTEELAFRLNFATLCAIGIIIAPVETVVVGIGLGFSTSLLDIY
jgi:hypothetical protein